MTTVPDIYCDGFLSWQMSAGVLKLMLFSARYNDATKTVEQVPVAHLIMPIPSAVAVVDELSRVVPKPPPVMTNGAADHPETAKEEAGPLA